MKILIADDSRGSNAWTYIRLGMARGFACSGHEVLLWDIYAKSAIDMFDEFKPDIFWGQTYNLDRGLIKAISYYPDCKVFLTAADYSPFARSIDLNKYPVLVATDKEIKAVEELKRLTRKPDFVCVHYHQNRIEQTHSDWMDRLGIPFRSLMPAADIMDYVGGITKDEFKSDITHVSGYWPFKAQIINKWFFPLCDSFLNLNIKVFGNRNWPIPQYCGFIDTKYVKHAFKSAKLNINLSEPHAHVYGYEINEKIFKLLAGKNRVLSDYTESMASDVFPDGIEYAKTPKEFKEKALAIINNELQINQEIGYQKVMNEHTYIHRAADVFKFLNLNKEGDDIIKEFLKLRIENNI